jgi:hypothetical protein
MLQPPENRRIYGLRLARKPFALEKANVKIAAVIEQNALKQYAQKCFSLRRGRLP